MPRVLVVEDDVTMGRQLADGLRGDGYEVVVALTGAGGILAATSERVDVIATDVMLPDVDGFEICRYLRERGVATPIILLTARDAVDDRVRGLDCGADDYLVKPFAFAELSARVRALLRRPAPAGAGALAIGPLRLDAVAHELDAGGAPIALSRRETAVLRVLLETAGEEVARQRLLDEVWGTGFVDPTIVDQYIRYLRRKLAAATDRVVVETVRGVGYRIALAP